MYMHIWTLMLDTLKREWKPLNMRTMIIFIYLITSLFPDPVIFHVMKQILRYKAADIPGQVSIY